MKKYTIAVLLLWITMYQINAQIHQSDKEIPKHQRDFRLVGVLSHTLINNEGLDILIVPSLGLDVEYWFNHHWGIGLHNDIEVQTFKVKNAEDDEIERHFPLVLTIDALYHFDSGIGIILGPGIELEKEESFYLFRVGIEYKKDISHSFYLQPSIFTDQRFGGDYNTWNIGLGIGVRL